MSETRFWEQWDQVATSMDAYWSTATDEEWYRKTLSEILKPWIKETGLSYLDVGCGSGLLLKQIMADGSKPHSLAGIDNSLNMIALARKRVPEAACGIGDVFSLAYPDSSIDVVGAMNLLSHVPDPKPALREMWRVAWKAVFFTAVVGEQASTTSDFWGASRFIRNTFTHDMIQAIVSEICGPDAILIKARAFPHQRMILYAIFKPNREKRPGRHTVILGSYNRPKLVKRAIRSVLAQTERDWQLIIADDGSNDDTVLSIHEEIAGDPRIIFNPCRNPLVADIRTGCSSRACQRINDALPLVKGQFVHYLADDDWYDPARFSIFDEIFKDPAVHCAYGRVVLMNREKHHGSIFPKSPCTKPLSNLDHNQIAHRVETFQVVKEWPVEEKGDYALEGHYFNTLAEHWPFVGLDKVVAYKMYHPFNMQATREQSTSVREL